jgi:Skp family chaperone for outer membrane proteins
MNKIMLIFLSVFGGAVSSAHAEEVFKCVIDYKTVYQAEPCPNTAVKTKEINIQPEDPAKAAEAQAKLQAWKENFKEREAAEKQAQQEHQAELDRQAAIDALNRNARALEEEAAAAAQQRRNFNRFFFGYGNPSYGGYGSNGYYSNDFNPYGNNPYSFGRGHHRHEERAVMPQPKPSINMSR